MTGSDEFRHLPLFARARNLGIGVPGVLLCFFVSGLLSAQPRESIPHSHSGGPVRSEFEKKDPGKHFGVDSLRDRLPPPSHLFWTMRTETATIHMLGSVHVGEKGMYPLPYRIEKALAESGILAIEADTRGAKGKDIVRLLTKIGFYHDGRTLEAVLGHPLYDRVFERLRQQSLSLTAIKRIKPWAASLMLGRTKTPGNQFSADWGVEQYLLRKASQTTNVEELEGATLQLEAFDSIPEKEQIAMVQESMEQTEDITGRMIDAWAAGDADRFTEVFLNAFRTKDHLGATYDILIVNRNRGMANRIIDYAGKNGTVFVVIGAGHFVGPRSIIHMLQERGFHPRRN